MRRDIYDAIKRRISIADPNDPEIKKNIRKGNIAYSFTARGLNEDEVFDTVVEVRTRNIWNACQRIWSAYRNTPGFVEGILTA